MNIKVDYEKLDDVTNTVKKNSTSLEKEIDRLLEALEELRLIWKGIDAEIFYKNAHDYISRMKILPSFQQVMGDFIKDSSNQYEDNDKEFSDKLKKEKDEIEQDNNFEFGRIPEDNQNV